MLDPLDAAVAQRDPQIPGLAVALDPEAVGALLSDRLPAYRGRDVFGLTPHYTRYKPCSNCLVGYELRLRGGERVPVHVKAFRGPGDPRLAKAAQRESLHTAVGPAYIIERDLALVVSIFPNDPKVDQLWRWFEPSQVPDLHRRVLKRTNLPQDTRLALSPLAYKPERRFVGRLSDPSGRGVGVLKLFRRGTLPPVAMRRFTRRVNERARLEGDMPRVPEELTRDVPRSWLALRWIEGEGLRQRIAGHEPITGDMEAVGAALAALHASSPESLVPRRDERSALTQTLALIQVLMPQLGPRLRRIAARIEDRIDPLGDGGPIHGDFYAKQVLIGEGVAFLDFDGAGLGPRGWDVGCFLAHLDRDRLRGAVRPERARVAEAALIEGYGRSAPGGVPSDLDAQRALALLQIATHPFRRREPEWNERITAIVREAEALVMSRSSGKRSASIPATDPNLPSLAAALDVEVVQEAFDADSHEPRTAFLSAELLRLKPGRRALVSYRVESLDAHEGPERQDERWLGKLRRRGLDHRTLDLSRALWGANFGEHAADGIEIPEPLGGIESLGMWFQRRVPGTPVESLLDSLDPQTDGDRLAAAFHKLHSSAAPVGRLHTAEDEIAALLKRLRRWQAEDRSRASRIQSLLDASIGVVTRLETRDPGRIVHRDLHLGQVLVGPGGRVWLVDLDLVSRGDPALDVGNFVAHLIEVGLRHGHREQHRELAECLVDAGRRLRRVASRGHVELYTQLSLARLAELSRFYPERLHTTDALIELASQDVVATARRIA